MAVSTLKLRKATIDRTQLLKSSPILSYLSSAKAVPPNACKAEQGREVTNELPGGMVLERNCLPYRQARHSILFSDPEGEQKPAPGTTGPEGAQGTRVLLTSLCALGQLYHRHWPPSRNCQPWSIKQLFFTGTDVGRRHCHFYRYF